MYNWMNNLNDFCLIIISERIFLIVLIQQYFTHDWLLWRLRRERKHKTTKLFEIQQKSQNSNVFNIKPLIKINYWKICKSKTNEQEETKNELKLNHYLAYGCVFVAWCSGKLLIIWILKNTHINRPRHNLKFNSLNMHYNSTTACQQKCDFSADVKWWNLMILVNHKQIFGHAICKAKPLGKNPGNN